MFFCFSILSEIYLQYFTNFYFFYLVLLNYYVQIIPDLTLSQQLTFQRKTVETHSVLRGN